MSCQKTGGLLQTDLSELPLNAKLDPKGTGGELDSDCKATTIQSTQCR